MSIENPDKLNNKNSPGISGGKLFLMSISSAIIYVLISLLIFHFYHEEGLAGAFRSGFSVGIQLLIGGLSGCIAAAIICFIIYHPPVSKVLSDFYIIDFLSKAKYSKIDTIQLSFFAGTGEELLFRGAIQPLLGNVLTSVIFVGIHGYFKFNSIGHILFGAMMFSLSFMLGLLFEYAGLIAAMSAHAIYDIIMLYIVQKKGLQQTDS